jgi:hypothetical protein
MRGILIRRVVAAIAIALWWLLVLAWAAGVRPGMPWSPAVQHTLAGKRLNTVMGVAVATGLGLRVDSLGDYRQALQSWRLVPPLEAGDFALLRYHVEDFPRTLELDLIFRSSDDPADVVVVPLPWPDSGEATLDLRRVPQWHGKVLEVGFTEFDASGQLPPELPFRPFTLAGARLESPSWRGAFADLATAWFDYQPWTMSAVNSVQVEKNQSPHRSPAAVLAAGTAGTLALLAGLLAVRGRRLLRIAAVLALAAWVMLDLHWLARLHQRHEVTHAVFDGKPWSERAGMQFDRSVISNAERMRQVLATQPPGHHILLWAPDKSQTIRYTWFLRPLNVSLLRYGTRPRSIPDGTLLMVDNSDDRWSYDGSRSLLLHGSFRIHGDLLYHQGVLMLLSIRQDAGT